MSRSVFPFQSNDISLLARSLVKQWETETTSPTHLQMLNMLARAVGFENFQHWRAEAIVPPAAAPSPASIDLPPAAAPTAQLDTPRLLRYFDEQGRLSRWPGKFSHQLPCLWPIWARIPARQTFSEREVNEWIKAGESMGDHVLLRRELVNYKLLARTQDGREYRRVEQPLPAEVAVLLREVLRRSVPVASAGS